MSYHDEYNSDDEYSDDQLPNEMQEGHDAMHLHRPMHHRSSNLNAAPRQEDYRSRDQVLSSLQEPENPVEYLMSGGVDSGDQPSQHLLRRPQSQWTLSGSIPDSYPLYHESTPLEYIDDYYGEVIDAQHQRQRELEEDMERQRIQDSLDWTPECEWSPTEEQFSNHQRRYGTCDFISESQVEEGYLRNATREGVTMSNLQGMQDSAQYANTAHHDFAYADGRPLQWGLGQLEAHDDEAVYSSGDEG